MRISRKVDYAIVFLHELASGNLAHGFRSMSEICKVYSLPESFLEKLAEKLREAKIIESKRGSRGGYRLAKNPSKITIKELMDILDEPPLMRCLSAKGKSACALSEICPARKNWLNMQNEVEKTFQRVTISSFVK